MGIIKIEFGEKRRFISVEEGLSKLRSSIERRWLSHIQLAGRLIWILIGTIVAWIISLFLEYFLVYPFFGTLGFEIALLVGTCLLALNMSLEIKKLIGRRSRKGVLIGRRFPHYTQAGAGERPVEVGSSGELFIDYLGEPNHHILINGSTSSGKTATLLTFTIRASLSNNLKFLMIDWNGENEEWANSIGATLWKVPLNFKINLFKLNGLSKESRASIAVENLIVAAHLTALQATKVKSSLLKFYIEGNEPTVFDLWHALCSKETGKANILNQRFRAIQRVIGYEPDEFWSGIFSRNNVISLAGLNESEKSLVVYALMQRLSELFDKKPELRKEPKLMVILDEAWQFFKREREFDAHRESSLEKVVRLGRKYGFGLVVSTQQIEDVPKVFINSCSLLMLHQQREFTYMGRDILGLGSFESSYIKSAAQGEMLLFDRRMSGKGQWYPDYVKVKPVSDEEIGIVSKKYARYIPDTIYEPEMPIEMNDNYLHANQFGKWSFKDLDIPSVTVYRFIIALFRTNTLTEAYRFVREKDWITSKPTLYGGSGKPSILARAISSSYAKQDGTLTLKGLEVVDPNRLIAKQGVLAGSEEHKRLMEMAIKRIQDNGNFAFVPKEKDSFDVGEINAKTRTSWDLEHLTVYECQTNSIKEEIEKCMAKGLNARLVFVTNRKETGDAITKMTGAMNVVV